MGKPCTEPDYRDRVVMQQLEKMKLPEKRTFLFCVVIASLFLSTCGIEEYYYLPQVPEINIRTQFNTSATINLPPLTSFYYAQNYKIFYRIYISGYFETGSIDTQSIRNTVSPSLDNDFRGIYPNTDSTSTSAGIPANTLFGNYNYFELELDGADINNMLSKNGGNVSISFPTTQGGFPVMSFNNGVDVFNLKRSGKLTTPLPDKDSSFRNSTELSAPENANSINNADVSARTGLTQRFAYVSMYIVAAGMNPVGFTPVYSKPTHISVFRLPDN